MDFLTSFPASFRDSLFKYWLSCEIGLYLKFEGTRIQPFFFFRVLRGMSCCDLYTGP